MYKNYLPDGEADDGIIVSILVLMELCIKTGMLPHYFYHFS